MICNLDCLNCPYDDCVIPDEQVVVTVLEETESERRDQEAWRLSCPADYPDAQTQEKKRIADRKARYRMANREKLREYHRNYKERRKEHYREINRAYYAKNRERIDAYRAEKRKRDRLLKSREKE